MIDAGLPVGTGSDGLLNPYIEIMGAVTHPTQPGERVDVATVLTGHTTGSAVLEGRDYEKGRATRVRGW